MEPRFSRWQSNSIYHLATRGTPWCHPGKAPQGLGAGSKGRSAGSGGFGDRDRHSKSEEQVRQEKGCLRSLCVREKRGPDNGAFTLPSPQLAVSCSSKVRGVLRLDCFFSGGRWIRSRRRHGESVKVRGAVDGLVPFCSPVCLMWLVIPAWYPGLCSHLPQASSCLSAPPVSTLARRGQHVEAMIIHILTLQDRNGLASGLLSSCLL